MCCWCTWALLLLRLLQLQQLQVLELLELLCLKWQLWLGRKALGLDHGVGWGGCWHWCILEGHPGWEGAKLGWLLGLALLLLV